MSIEYLREQLSQNEQILHSARQHWMFLVRRILLAALLAAAIAVVVYFLDRWTSGHLLAWGYLLLLAPAALMGWRLLEWRARVYVVTNRRVARVAGVLNKNVKDSSLEKVNDVILSQSLLGRLLGFGTIEILTASEAGLNKMVWLGDPVAFKQTMSDAKEAFEREFSHSG